jgi:hypothetical protein
MHTDETGMNLEFDDATSQGDAPDLQSQLESLLGTVWERERWARTEDRIDTAVRYGSVRS